ncbi:LemA family protein [Candidatus Gracilibacteria bacterium]|nr:MAG: LemA family protein [Candidatus Gracilibacteria bacterium]
MKKRLIGLGITIAVLAILYSATIGKYNNLVNLEETVKTQRSQVQNVYQRRFDLIPNLVATVKGEANFEKQTLTDVINARASASQIKVDINNAEEFAKYQAAQGQLSQALGRLMVLTENYPNLQANQSFRDLRVQLEGTENRITVERMNYNAAAQVFNTQIRIFPTSIIAKIFDFQRANLFEATKGAEVAPTVEF